MHKPNQYVGTGYQIHTEITKPTLKHAEDTFIFKPHWAIDNNNDIQKYKSFEEYQQRETVLKYIEVKEV